ALSALVILAVAVAGGPGLDLLSRARIGGAFLVAFHVDLYLLGVLYFPLRDRLCGGLGVRPSWPWGAARPGLSSLVPLASGVSFPLLGLGSVSVSLELLYLWYPFAILAPLALVGGAWLLGPGQIRHTEWACLDIGQ